MCQSSVYAVNSGRQDLLLGEVTRLEIDGENVTVEPLFGEAVLLKARIKEIDLAQQRIVVERL